MRHTALSCFSTVKAARFRCAAACGFLLVNSFYLHRLYVDYFIRLFFFFFYLPELNLVFPISLLFVSCLYGNAVKKKNSSAPVYCLTSGQRSFWSLMVALLCYVDSVLVLNLLLGLLDCLMLVNLIWDYCIVITIICPPGRSFFTITAGFFFQSRNCLSASAQPDTKWMEPKR